MEDVEDEAIEHDDTLEDNKMADLNFSGYMLLGDCITDLLLSVNTNLSGKEDFLVHAMYNHYPPGPAVVSLGIQSYPLLPMSC